MAAGRRDIVIELGATYTEEYTWNDSTGSAVDLTGASAAWMLRYHIDDASPAVDLSTSSGGITIAEAEGKVTVTISAAATAALSSGFGVHDLLVTKADGTKTRLVSGSATLLKGVTR